jgi:HD-like signal output (HDOD) protein
MSILTAIKAFFSRFLSSPTVVRVRNTDTRISTETLEQLFPIRNLSREILETFALDSHSELVKAESILFVVHKPSDSAIYLLDGVVTLSDEQGKSYDIDAQHPKAKFPLSSGQIHTTTAIAKTDITILRVSLNIMATNGRNEHGALEIPEDCRDNKLLALFADHYQNHELELPALPEIAHRIQAAMQKDLSVEDMARIIQLDPIISAKLIEMANCPLYLNWQPIKNCGEAIRRIGIKATRGLVIAISARQVFSNSASPVKHHLERQWKQSLYLSALSHVLASHTQQQNPEDALLAGLVCDIGVIPFLSFVSNLPREYINDYEIEQALPVIKGEVGATVLREWGFAEEFVNAARSGDNWYQDNGKYLSLTDIVTLSRLHSMIGKSESNNLPVITSIPAAAKLKNFELSPENSLAILYNAKYLISDAMRILDQ